MNYTGNIAVLIFNIILVNILLDIVLVLLAIVTPFVCADCPESR